MHYATNRKVAGSIPDEVNFEIYLILPAALGHGVYSTEMSIRNIKIIMFLGNKVQRMRKADSLTAIYELII
jgi:hypothetical protein